MKTPVAVFFYRRPHLVAGLLEALRVHRPQKIWLISDGPKEGHPGDARLCQKTRSTVEKMINWPCDLNRVYAKRNLGLHKRFESGLDAIFSREPKAILLEEDCHPTPDFIPFCEELLNAYQNEKKVAGISGNCFLRASAQVQSSYFYSKYLHIWGWATWARVWNQYDRREVRWPDRGFQTLFPDATRQEIDYWNRIYRRVIAGQYSWDYALFAWMWSHGLLSINPTQNLVRNVGFGPEATNTVDPYMDLGIERANSLRPPYRAPEGMKADNVLDWDLFQNSLLRMEGRRNLWQKLRDRCLRALGLKQKHQKLVTPQS